jgi:AcrR family transcriptional regulator
MSAKPLSAREKILKAAAHLFYLEGVRSVSVDAIAERAGVTKKTLYYHFASKDELIAAYLTLRDQPNLEVFTRWLAEAEGAMPERIEAFFVRVAEAGKHPKWRGCGFLRTTAELANMPGHPARLVGACHKKKVEHWLEQQFRGEGIAEPCILARQISVLIDGSFSAMLVHRDPSYALMAGKAARALTEGATRVEAAA